MMINGTVEGDIPLEDAKLPDWKTPIHIGIIHGQTSGKVSTNDHAFIKNIYQCVKEKITTSCNVVKQDLR
jgi:hypothetical protein